LGKKRRGTHVFLSVLKRWGFQSARRKRKRGEKGRSCGPPNVDESNEKGGEGAGIYPPIIPSQRLQVEERKRGGEGGKEKETRFRPL